MKILKATSLLEAYLRNPLCNLNPEEKSALEALLKLAALFKRFFQESPL